VDTATPQEATPSPVPIGVHDFAGIAWPSGGWLVVGLNPDNVSAPNEIWRLRPDGLGFRRLSLPDDPACQRTDYLSPVALPDGSAGFVKACFLDSDEVSIRHPSDPYFDDYGLPRCVERRHWARHLLRLL
jgi:hypothetical protein